MAERTKSRAKGGKRAILLGVLNIFLVMVVSLQYTMFPQDQHSSEVGSLPIDSNVKKFNPPKEMTKKKIPPHFVTVVLPSPVNEKGTAKRLNSIQETWGPESRAVFVVSSDIPEVSDLPFFNNIPAADWYPQVLRLPDSLTENDVPRLRYIIEQIHQTINPDFAFFVNDHTYVIPDHLCDYLKGRKSTEDMYEGHAMQTNEHVFNSGAAGYFLSRTTMTKLVQSWSPSSNNPQCTFVSDQSTTKQRFLQKSPGLFLTSCLLSMNIKAIDTRESPSHSHLFHAFPLTKITAGKIDGWYRDKHKVETAVKLGTDESYAILLDGEECCAPASATFHYVEDLETRALFAIRKKLLTNPNLTDAELQEIMISVWPKTKKEYGGYNQGLPKLEKEEMWKPLLATVRKISGKALEQKC